MRKRIYTPTTKDVWDQIAERTQPFGLKSWHVIRFKSSHSRIQLKPDCVRSVLPAMFVISGAFLILLAIFSAKDLSLTARLFPFGLGAFLCFLYFFGLLTFSNFIKKISWDIYGSEIEIIYRNPLLRKTLSVDRNHLEVCLDVCNRDIRNSYIRRGSTVLSLKRIDQDRPELIIAVSLKKSSLKKAFAKLNEFLAKKGEDKTLVKVNLSKDKIITLPKTALADSRHTGAENKTLLFPSCDMAIFRRNFDFTLIGLLGIGIGLLIPILPFVFEQKEDRTLDILLGCTIFGGLLFFFSLLFVLRLFRTRYTVADKKTDTLEFKTFISPLSKGKFLCNLSEIIAVQLCQYGSSLADGSGGLVDVTIYELNVVLDKPESKRINILRSGNSTQTYDYGQNFANFLSMPLLDHRSV